MIKLFILQFSLFSCIFLAVSYTQTPVSLLCSQYNVAFFQTATLVCCGKCPRPEKTVQMLASAKLCLQTLIARVKVSSDIFVVLSSAAGFLLLGL